MSIRMLAAMVVGLAVTQLSAEPTQYDFRDPKGVNAVSFLLDSPLEPIIGYAGGVSGMVTYDPDNPKATKGKIVVDAASLEVPNKRMTDVMHSEDWLDVAKHKTIEFQFVEVKSAKKIRDNVQELKVNGKFSLHGVTKDKTVTVRMTSLPDKLGARGGGKKGDVLLLRTSFELKRTDYDIKKGAPTDKVADRIQLKAAIAGSAPK